MRYLIFITLVVVPTMFLNAQLMAKRAELELAKNDEILVFLTGDEKVDSAFSEAIKNF